jgi:hypothetical protein
MAKPSAAPKVRFPATVDIAKALPRHESKEFMIPRGGFFLRLGRLMSELDDDCEFVRLETSGRSLLLTIRHR